MNRACRIIRFSDINYQSLGHYFMGLGLLRAVSGKWLHARGCWHEGLFCLIGTFSQDEVMEFLKHEWQPTAYERWWDPYQKADKSSSIHLWKARSQRTMPQVRIADTTIVPGTRNRFNPVFGTGGNIGRRDLQVAWCRASTLTEDPHSGLWLESALFGSDTELPQFTNAGTWFVYNNKAFNSGQNWYREGFLSPWSFLLACEGSLILRGGH